MPEHISVALFLFLFQNHRDFYKKNLKFKKIYPKILGTLLIFFFSYIKCEWRKTKFKNPNDYLIYPLITTKWIFRLIMRSIIFFEKSKNVHYLYITELEKCTHYISSCCFYSLLFVIWCMWYMRIDMLENRFSAIKWFVCSLGCELSSSGLWLSIYLFSLFT